MKIIKPTALVAVLLLILSCNQQANKNLAVQDEAIPLTKEIDNNADKKTLADANQAGAFNADPKGDQSPPQKKDEGKQKQEPRTDPVIKPDWDKKIIKNASVNLEVKDYNNYYTSLREKIKNLGGYVAQEEQTQSDYKIENVMTIKVPVDQFDNAIALFASNAQKINERKITSQDVTTEVVDTRSRMEAKKQVRQRYMDLLGEAKNMQDILNVQSSINGVQEEIESAAGRIEYLTHSSVFSTINLIYYQVLNSSAKAGEEVSNPSFGKKIINAFKGGWEIITEIFVGLVSIWPLLLGSFFVYVLVKKLRKTKPAEINKTNEA